MGAAHRAYTRQFKEEAVQLVVREGQEPTRVARELGMPYTTLVQWLEKAGWHRPQPDRVVTSDDPAMLKTQIRELQRRLKRAEMEKEILKKSDRLLCEPAEWRFAFIRRRRGEFPVSLMCQVLQVARSGYYAWRNRDASPRQQRREQFVQQIRQMHHDSRCSYGSPRITVELKEQGCGVCENTVAKYMREEGICVKPRRRFVPRTTDSDHAHPIAPNPLNRDFKATTPNQKWACDLTYIFTEEGWLYLSVVIDLFSRRVIGWSMSNNLKAQSVAETLGMALRQRRANRREGLLHHSDRGVQYACELYQRLLARHGIQRSMSRPGNCYDNAVVESFFGTLKSELVHRRRYRTRAEAKTSIFQWIECWYNRQRRHSSLGYTELD